MHVMLTSAGRRTSLLAAFKEAAAARGGKVNAGDLDGLAPALFLADAAVALPRVLTPEYLPRLLEVVREHGIGCLVPTIDTDLLLLAQHANAFKELGCTTIGSKASLIQIARDKWVMAEALGKKGIRVAHSWLPEHIAAAEASNDLPESLFVKPRDGSASAHTHRVRRQDLASILPRVPNAIVQEDVRAPEITIDALVDFEGRPIHYVPRLRIKTVGGESVQGRTVSDANGLGPWLVRVLEAFADLGARGPLTLQAFLTDGEPTFSEINPRFGGGFPLAYAAGAHYPEWLLDLVEGKRVAPHLGEYTRDLYMTRAYTERFVEKPLWS